MPHLLIYIALLAVIYVLAKRWKRNPVLWVIVSLFLSPIVVLIVLWVFHMLNV